MGWRRGSCGGSAATRRACVSLIMRVRPRVALRAHLARGAFGGRRRGRRRCLRRRWRGRGGRRSCRRRGGRLRARNRHLQGAESAAGQPRLPWNSVRAASSSSSRGCCAPRQMSEEVVVATAHSMGGEGRAPTQIMLTSAHKWASREQDRAMRTACEQGEQRDGRGVGAHRFACSAAVACPLLCTHSTQGKSYRIAHPISRCSQHSTNSPK